MDSFPQSPFFKSKHKKVPICIKHVWALYNGLKSKRCWFCLLEQYNLLLFVWWYYIYVHNNIKSQTNKIYRKHSTSGLEQLKKINIDEFLGYHWWNKYYANKVIPRVSPLINNYFCVSIVNIFYSDKRNAWSSWCPNSIVVPSPSFSLCGNLFN